LIGNLHDDRSFVVRDVNVKETSGRIWVDVDAVGFGWLVWIYGTITSFCKQWIKDKWVDIGLDTGENTIS